MVKTKCDYCGKVIHKTPLHMKTNTLHFCNREEYLKYRTENNYYSRKYKMTASRKIKKLAELREKKNGLEKSKMQ